MKKTIVLLLMAVLAISVNAQFKVFSDGKVTVNETTNTLPAKLTVGPTNYQYPSYQMGSYTRTTLASTGISIAVRGDANSSTSSTNGRSYGMFGLGGNASNGYNYGVVGAIAGSNSGAGIYGSYENVINYVPGTYAGYFRGATCVDGTMTATSFVTPSDSRLKVNVESLSDKGSALDNVLGMNVITYKYKEREIAQEVSDTAQTATLEAIKNYNQKLASRNHFGLFAQELQEIYPDLVEKGQDGYLGVNYVELVPILICAIQELKGELDAVKGNDGSARKASAATSVSTTSTSGNVLYQNSPNPFKEQTTIRFSLADDAQSAAICIFDMTGKMLRNLPVSLGETSVSLNGWELGEGMFLYTLIVNGKEIDTKRMIITR